MKTKSESGQCIEVEYSRSGTGNFVQRSGRTENQADIERMYPAGVLKSKRGSGQRGDVWARWPNKRSQQRDLPTYFMYESESTAASLLAKVSETGAFDALANAQQTLKNLESRAGTLNTTEEKMT